MDSIFYGWGGGISAKASSVRTSGFYPNSLNLNLTNNVISVRIKSDYAADPLVATRLIHGGKNVQY
jgi:hypothetical protein